MKTLVQKSVLILSGILFISNAPAQQTIRVEAGNIFFSPSSFSASIGDTIKWYWGAGTHTTTSLSVPAGAASWNHNMDDNSPSDTSFKYTITTAGVYSYWCSIHQTMMEGSFTVVATGIPNVSNSSKKFAQVFPNPADQVININLSVNPIQNKLIITDIQGKEVINQMLSKLNNAIDVSSWAKGVYMYHLENNGEVMDGKFEVQ